MQDQKQDHLLLRGVADVELAMRNGGRQGVHRQWEAGRPRGYKTVGQELLYGSKREDGDRGRGALRLDNL